MTLTRTDPTTGQRLYDYQIKKVISPNGSAQHRDEYGTPGYRYDLVEFVVRRYPII